MLEKANNTDIKNLRKIDAPTEKTAKGKFIQDLEARWRKRNPREHAETLKFIKDRRENLKYKKFGFVGEAESAKNGGMRIGVALPPNLVEYVKAFYPKFTTEPGDVDLVKKYLPQYKIPEV